MSQPQDPLLAKIIQGINRQISIEAYVAPPNADKRTMRNIAEQLVEASMNTEWATEWPDKAYATIKTRKPTYIITIKNRRYLCQTHNFRLVNEDGDQITVPEVMAQALATKIEGFGIFCKDKTTAIYQEDIQRVLSNTDPGRLVKMAYVRLGESDERRWPEAEPYMLYSNANGYRALDYAIDIMGERWPEAEQMEIDDGIDPTKGHVESYLRSFGRISSWEQYMLNDGSLADAFEYAKILDLDAKTWPELREHLLTDQSKFCSRNIYDYIIELNNKKPWPEAEPVLFRALDNLEDKEAAWVIVEYQGLYGRWPRFEKFILEKLSQSFKDKDSELYKRYAYCAESYIEDNLKTEWPEAQQYLNANGMAD